MCIMGTKRKVSPFMLILFSTLLLYSLTLIKRLKKQHLKQNYKKQSVFTNFLWDFFPSYYEDTVTLYIITPTYPRPEQLPELTRLSQTLMVSFKKTRNTLTLYFFTVGEKCKVDCSRRCKYTNFSSITVAQTDTESIT